MTQNDQRFYHSLPFWKKKAISPDYVTCFVTVEVTYVTRSSLRSGVESKNEQKFSETGVCVKIFLTDCRLFEGFFSHAESHLVVCKII